MIERYASDIIVAAMRMAQQQALNSFSFRDIHHLLNQHWRYCYERIMQIDTGFYSINHELTEQLTRLPSNVLGTVHVFRSMGPEGYPRQLYTECGERDYRSHNTYRISGNDLWCWDVGIIGNTLEKIYVSYVPVPRTIFFTVHNRDPEIILEEDKPVIKPDNPKKWRYGMYRLRPGANYVLEHMADPNITFDITPILYRGPGSYAGTAKDLYDIVALFLDFPYAFVSYQHRATGDYHSVILRDLLSVVSRNKYNPFDFNGRDSKVKFLDAKYNDDTGMGVVIEDWDDLNDEGKPIIKKLGWTPDTLMTYPYECVADYMIAHMAKRFANRNESTIMDIDHAIALAEHEMTQFLKKDKNPWGRVNNVVGTRISDYL